MKVLVASDDSGSVKIIKCQRGTDTSVQKATQPESITTVCEESRQTRVQQFITFQDYLIASRANGSICFYDMENEYEQVARFEQCTAGPTDLFVSLVESFGLIYSCTESGVITVINTSDLKASPATANITGPVSAFISHPLQRGVFAYGGKENDVKIISLFESVKDKDLKDNLKPVVLFQAKNVKNDKLDLRVPIWVSRIMFVDVVVKRGVWKFITVTRYGQMRKYDTLHGRKPVSDIKVSEKPLLTLAQSSSPEEIICSDTHTTTAKFNINKGTLVGKFKGSVGSVQALHTFLEGNLIATGGLDRYFRAFDIDSREAVAKVYTGSQISCVQILEDDEGEDDGEDDAYGEDEEGNSLKRSKEEEEASDDEKLWNRLDSNTRVAKKVKKN